MQHAAHLKISDHGLIGNSRAAALVSKRGAIDWCCLPRFDSPSFFSSLLGAARNGVFSIDPIQTYESTQSYVENTNVLQTTFKTSSGEVRLTDCFTVASEEEKKNRLWPDDEILRVLEGISGTVIVRMRFRPCEDYGESGIRLKRQGNWAVKCESGERLLFLQVSHLDKDSQKNLTVIRFEEGSEALAEFLVGAGEKVYFSLIYADKAPAIFPPLGDPALERLGLTISYWRRWLSQCTYVGPYFKEVHRSALVLKLLSYAPSGAIIASPTTSLPEVFGGSRNWDYRYCWLRDASFTVNALLNLGFITEAKAYVSWLLHSTRLTRPRLQPLYSIFGIPELNEKSIPWLDGFRGSRPVRIGNAASNQFQLDIYGEVIAALYKLLPYLARCDGETKKLLYDMAISVKEIWREPDEGIWEVRSGPALHTHSKVLAWVALDRFIKICRHHDWQIPEGFVEAAAAIREAIETRGFSTELNSYTRTFDSEDLDSSLLILPLAGFCTANCAKMMGTIEAVRKDLSRNGLLYRYLPGKDGIQDQPAQAEGAFGLCSFWMAECLIHNGQLEEGKKWIENVLRHFSETGLCSEEISPDSGELLGNYPQGFTHVGLINAAVQLATAEKMMEAA